MFSKTDGWIVSGALLLGIMFAGSPVWAGTEVNASQATQYQGVTSAASFQPDPRKFLVGALDGSSAAPATYYSQDAGASFAKGTLPLSYGGHAYLEGGSPAVSADAQGVWWAAYAIYDPVSGNPTDTTIAVAKSFNGMLWTAIGTPVAQCCSGVADPAYSSPAIAADADGCSSSANGLYVAWVKTSGGIQSIFFSASHDGGASWSTPFKVDDGTSGAERLARPRVATGPGGVVYVTWLDAARKKIFLDVSTNWGASFGTDKQVADVATGCGSADCGLDLGCSGGLLHGSTPEIAVDGGWSAGRGTIYVIFADDLGTGNGMDIFLTKSADQGNNWTALRFRCHRPTVRYGQRGTTGGTTRATARQRFTRRYHQTAAPPGEFNPIWPVPLLTTMEMHAGKGHIWRLQRSRKGLLPRGPTTAPAISRSMSAGRRWPTALWFPA